MNGTKSSGSGFKAGRVLRAGEVFCFMAFRAVIDRQAHAHKAHQCA
jgi:hypothetical protein